jgi:hypothetical protein
MKLHTYVLELVIYLTGAGVGHVGLRDSGYFRRLRFR